MPPDADVAVVVVALAPSPRLVACLEALRASRTGARVRTLCVVVDRAEGPPVQREGVTHLSPGANLGWAGGVHLARSHTDAPLLWLIQDDVVVRPDTLSLLLEALDADAGLSAVRPLVVDDQGLVPAGSCGAVLDGDGEPAVPVPPSPVLPAGLGTGPVPTYLPSSGQLIRTAAWDEVGGFDPWFYPVNFIDVDLGHALRHAGRRICLAPRAAIAHAARGSTPSLLGEFTVARNHILLRAKWYPHALPPPEERAPFVAEHIVEAVAAGRGARRDTSPASLAHAVAASAGDSYLRFARWATRRERALRDDYSATAGARDWWRAQFEQADQDYRNALAERDRLAAEIGTTTPQPAPASPPPRRWRPRRRGG